jgi:hypothetical protein
MDTRGRPDKHDDSGRLRGPCKYKKKLQLHVNKYKYIKLPSRPQEKAATKVLGKDKRSPETNAIRAWSRETPEYRRLNERHGQKTLRSKVYKLCDPIYLQ